MRLGAKRRICITCNHVSKGKLSVGIILLFLTVSCLGGAAYFIKIIRPLMIELAKNEAGTLAELAIHRSLGKLFQNTDYREIVTVSRLEDGTVSDIQSNMGRVNSLKADASIAINHAITSIDHVSMAIPLGSLTGYEFLAGFGPRISVQLMPYGSATVDFQTEFTETGINQTLLSVKLTVQADVGIVMPSVNTTQQVVTEIPVTQTLIVGKIPDNYVNIDRMGEDYEGDVLDIIG